MKINALLIGCGNIGAQYDLRDQTKVWSHAKAYHLREEIELSVTDIDDFSAREVADIYHVPFISPNNIDYKKFDLISVTTPTPTHGHYLSQLFASDVPVVICEKPVVDSINVIDDLRNLYHTSSTKVLVNYMRRFQPAFERAKAYIKDISENDLSAIIIKYKRGFLNNASHAIDLLEYLFDNSFEIYDFNIHTVVFDAFQDDPTITGTCFSLNCPVSFVGLTDIDYAFFEIELYFRKHRMMVSNSGNEIRYFKINTKTQVFEEEEDKKEENILNRYMEPVVEKAVDLFRNAHSTDNFLPALEMNSRVLNFLQSIKMTT